LDQEKASKEYVQATFFGDESASHSNHEWDCEKPNGRAQGLGMRVGSHYHSAPNPIRGPCGSLQKQEKTKIKTKLPDGTNYQMVPFRTGSNEDYVNHIIALIRLVEQKDLENSVEKVFVAASKIEEKVGPLYKKLNMSKDLQEKEGLKKKIETTEKDLKKAEKKALAEIVKAYELFRTYFIGKACTQWDKVVQEMHQKDLSQLK
jgi:hypothetical protein